MSGTKSVAVVIAISLFILMVIYDTYFNEKSILGVLKSKIKNSSFARSRALEHKLYHNFTRDRVIHLQYIIDQMRQYYGMNRTQKIENTSSREGNFSSKPKKVVLGYTTYFGNKPWGWMKNSYEFNHWEGIQCPYFTCELTFNRRDRQRSDALIFHARDMPPLDTMRYILEKKDPKQRWIYFAMESPMHNPSAVRLFDMFNWTMNYRKDSDIYRPYTYYFKSSTIPTMPANEYLKGKDRLAFWTASNCGLLRDEYVKKLLGYISVDVFGACRSTVGAKDVGDCPQGSKECENILKRYKFQLAFENSNCVDYITEKYWDGIKKGIVPVVMGGGHYDERTAIPGSFINVMDFKSVKDLANYLVFLDKNNDEYVKYFAWKSKYRITDYPPWNCVVCARLYLDLEPKFYERLDEIFDAEKNCGTNEKKLKRMIDS
ncbi:galactoside 3(4)-L-fucosyltransferase-like [Actinia tenebrosa]|uniref:Fucosyltransferase n=1 Tax=Actinia tenebrosa TaxID=6105 RepID=A0A6P8HE07_ACTTE|nr:galactoside 3(4)-L-fucosyltransferase-like [Actinia tenebrosa]